jgi:flagellar motor protein MotB
MIKKFEQYELSEGKLQKWNDFQTVNEELGWKDVVLGIGLLSGVLTGSVKSQAQNSLGKEKAIKNIEIVLNDTEKLNKVISDLETMGYTDAEQKIKDNAEGVKNKLNKRRYTKTSAVAKNQEDLAKKLNKGYAISSIDTKVLKQKLEDEGLDDVNAVESIELEFNNNDAFEAGGYILKQEFKDSLVTILEKLNMDGELYVFSVNIESSTDKQRISPKLKSKLSEMGYSDDNEGLSQLRNDNVKEVVENYDFNVIQKIRFEQGEGDVGAITPQDPSTRYVKVTINAIPKTKPPKEEVNEDSKEIDEIIYSFKLVKYKKKELPSIKIPPIKINKKEKRKICSPTDCFKF